MRVFLTGATGFIGSAIVPELLRAGHQVLGLARSDARAQALAATGAQVHRGDLEDLDSLRAGAAACDGVIHTAFIHDFSKFAENGQIDKRAIETMGAVLAGSGKPLVVSSGTGLVAPGRVATEDMAADGEDLPRVSEQTALAQVARGVRAMAIRLPPTVHGAGDHGFVPHIVDVARSAGVSAYVGDGANRWPAVHRLAAARLYRLALEKGTAGARYHAVAEDGVATRAIAQTIGQRLHLPVVSKTPEEAGAHFAVHGMAFIGMLFSLDIAASSAWTQAELGWTPDGPSLLSDLETHYLGG